MKANRLDAYREEEIVAIDKYAQTVSPVVALRALYELLEDYTVRCGTRRKPTTLRVRPWVGPRPKAA